MLHATDRLNHRPSTWCYYLIALDIRSSQLKLLVYSISMAHIGRYFGVGFSGICIPKKAFSGICTPKKAALFSHLPPPSAPWKYASCIINTYQTVSLSRS